MARLEQLPISVTRCRAVDGDHRFTVVWLDGEHDVSSRLALGSVIDRAADLDRCDVVVDLHGVTFMDASTIGALVAARNRMRARGLSLSVRAPSAVALWVLAVSGAADLVEAPAGIGRVSDGAALATWVDVPRGTNVPAAPVREPTPADTGHIPQPAVAVVALHERS